MVEQKLWIGLDGIDCTGKTSLVHALQSDIQLMRERAATVFEEFTNSHSGDALRKIISEHRFLSLSNPPNTRWADTHLLISDWSYKIEAFANSNYNLAISDRTYLSILGYQIARLEIQYPKLDVENSIGLLLDGMQLVQNSSSNTKYINVLLTVGAAEIQKRVLARGEAALNDQELSLLMRAQEIQKSLSPSLIIDTDNKSLADVIHEVRSVVGDEV